MPDFDLFRDFDEFGNKTNIFQRIRPAKFDRTLIEDRDVTSQVEFDLGIEPSEDQRAAAEAILLAIAEDTKVVTLVGPAGTGKTTLVRLLAALLKKQGLYIQYAAPTGKAAVRLSEVTGYPATTIHRILYGYFDTEDDNEAEPTLAEELAGKKKKRPRLIFGEPHEPCDENTVLIIDEASMVGEKLYRDLVEYLPKSSFLLFIGDREQLPPVGEEWGPDLVNPTAALTTIHRQAKGSQIIQLATHIRTGGRVMYFDFEGDIDLHRNAQLEPPAEWLAQCRKDGIDATLITYRNVIRQDYNDAVRVLRGLLSEEEALYGDPTVVAGDNLVVTANNYTLGMMNGEIYKVEALLGVKPAPAKLTGPLLEVKLEGRLDPVLIPRDFIGKPQFEFRKMMSGRGKAAKQYLHCDYGECLTIHKSQGSQWDEVGIVWDRAMWGMRYGEPDTFRRLMYTAATRAAKKLNIWVLEKGLT